MMRLLLTVLALAALVLPVEAQFRSGASGTGGIEVITIADPAAGVELTQTVPARRAWRLLGFSAALVTDATVANREVALVVDDATTVLLRSPTRQNHAASLTRLVSFFNLAGTTTPATDTTLTAPLPADLLVPATFRIRTLTTNFQAGDNWGAAVLLVEAYTR